MIDYNQSKDDQFFKIDHGRVRANLLSEMWVGAGNNTFRANRDGVFAGDNAYVDAPFQVSYQGGMTATNGSILGDFSITGEFNFLDSNGNTKGQIYASSGNLYIYGSGSHGMYIDNNGNVNIPEDSLTVYNDIQSTHGEIHAYNDLISDHGALTVYNDITSSHGGLTVFNDIETVNGNIYTDSGGMNICAGAIIGSNGTFYSLSNNDLQVPNGKITALNDIQSLNGSIHSKNDIYSSGGSVYCYNDLYTQHGSVKTADTYYAKDGSTGQTANTLWITALQMNSGNLQYKNTKYTFTCGLLTNVGSQSGWNTV